MTCCFCGKRIRGWGNNIAPFNFTDKPNAVCCDDYNLKYVIPARIYKIKFDFKEDEEDREEE